MKEVEAQELKRVEMMERKDKNRNDEDDKLKRVNIAPSELVRQYMRFMRLPQMKMEDGMFGDKNFNLKGGQS